MKGVRNNLAHVSSRVSLDWLLERGMIYGVLFIGATGSQGLQGL